LDRCALFVDASYALADGALAVHGTRNRDSVSWDHDGLLKLLSGLSTERTGIPLLRCYWYDCAAGGDRSAEHDALADLAGIKLRVSKIRPSRKEGVEAEIRRDLTALARNRAVSDVVIVSGEEDLAPVIAEVQDLGIRAVLMHIAADGDATISRSLRQECDDTIEVSALQLRPFVDLIAGAEPAVVEEQHTAAGYGGPAPAFRESAAAFREPAAAFREPAPAFREPAAGYREPAAAGYRDQAGGYGEMTGTGSREAGAREQALPAFRDPAAAPVRPASYPDRVAGPGSPGSGAHSAAPAAQPYASSGPPDYQRPGQQQVASTSAGRDPRDPLAAQDPARFGGFADQPPGHSGANPAAGQNGFAPAGFGQNGYGQHGFAAPEDANGHRGLADHQGSRQNLADGGREHGGYPVSAGPEGGSGRNGVHAAPAGNMQAFPGQLADGGVSQNGGQAMPRASGNGQRAGSPPANGLPGGMPGNGAAQGLTGEIIGQGSPAGGGDRNPLGPDPLARNAMGQNPMGQNPLAQDPLSQNPLTQNPLSQFAAPSQQPALPPGGDLGGRSMHAAPGPGQGAQPPMGMPANGGPQTGFPQGPPPGAYPQGGLPPAEAQRPLPARRQLPPGNGMPYPPDPASQYGSQSQSGPYGAPPGMPEYHLAPYPGSAVPAASVAPPSALPAPVPPAPVPAAAFSVAEAVQSAHAEGYGFGEAVARDAPALWLEAVLARKPRMPSDLEARLLQGSALPIDSLLHDEVRHALRRGFWDALERSRH
jgi:uncharacterized LabA/DUF88 family protein